jgi:hypothetical protein
MLQRPDCPCVCAGVLWLLARCAERSPPIGACAGQITHCIGPASPPELDRCRARGCTAASTKSIVRYLTRVTTIHTEHSWPPLSAHGVVHHAPLAHTATRPLNTSSNLPASGILRFHAMQEAASVWTHTVSTHAPCAAAVPPPLRPPPPPHPHPTPHTSLAVTKPTPHFTASTTLGL